MDTVQLSMEVEKADPLQGVIQLVVFKARPTGSGLTDRDEQGLDPEAAAAAMREWTANFGQVIDYISPITQRSEQKFCGMYDTHSQPVKARLLGSWYFPEEMKFRILVQPEDRQIAVDAAAGTITGASWAGSAFGYDYDVEE